MAAIELRGILKRYGTTTAVRALDIDIPDGRLTVLVGPSGCGKSTILKLIAGLEDVDGGELFIGGKAASHLRPAQRDIAMVFQSYALYPHMSVFENLAFPLRMARHSRPTIDTRVAEVATTLGLTELLARKPKALSGGQQQRVAIGRAMVRNPVAYLFDEPLSNLDAQLRAHMREEIAKLQSRLQTTMVFVTHDQTEAMTLADLIVVLNGGRVEQTGTPMELYRKPANRFVAAFIGAPPMNFLQGHIRDWTNGTVKVDLATGMVVSIRAGSAPLDDAKDLTIGIRPEHISLQAVSENEPALAGRVERIELLGSQTQIRVATAAGPLLVLQFGGCDFAAGDAVSLSLPESHCHLFNVHGEAL